MNPKSNEPNTAPPAEQWFPISLGSTLREPSSSTRFYSLRYEFKPASIDTTRPGSLHKSTDNKVTVDFCNNQAGKPKLSFQGNSEDCKDLDGILFFDGKGFRLERLHRAVKCLRHVRTPGESTGGAAAGSSGGGALASGGISSLEPLPSPGHLNGGLVGSAPNANVEKITHKHPMVQVEEITVGQIETPVVEKKSDKRKADAKLPKGTISPAPGSPTEGKGDEEVCVEVNNEVDERTKKLKPAEVPQVEVNIDEDILEEHESDYEIEDVDVSEDEEGVNAAEALRAEAAANQKQQSSSESSGSGSGTSGSGSGSGSSSSGTDESDEEESASSGDDI